jgi:hypothetical protein
MAVDRYWMGVDFGQAHDYTAVSVIERVPVATGETVENSETVSKSLLAEQVVTVTKPMVDHYHVRYLSRPPLRTSYDKIARGVVDRLRRLEPACDRFGKRREIGLAGDATGVGRGVTDMLWREIRAIEDGPRVIFLPVVVTGGNNVTRGGGFVNVPKRDLVNAGVILLQEERLRIGAAVENRDVLIRELLDYRVKINISTAHDSYEPWREGAHDDLLFSTCLASWAWSKTPNAS